MNSFVRAAFALTALVGVASAAGCVASRPARNGVFNENQYIRKDFLVGPGTTGADGKPVTDPGWFLVATVMQTSSPNPLGGVMFPGMQGESHLVRFRVTQDHLQMVDTRELTAATSPGRTAEVVDAWNATNVDLKYRVNLDGEQTNFYEENQEAPWADRQYVKLNLAKNDLSDVNVLGVGFPDIFNHCTDSAEATATLLPNSLKQVHGATSADDYLEWTTQVAVPYRTDVADCATLYGEEAQPNFNLGKANLTMNLKYSMRRAQPQDPTTGLVGTYKPLVISEKDAIQHKYGVFNLVTESRDPSSGQLASRQLVTRFDPQQDMVWYFEPGFPDKYKAVFNGPGGVKEQTDKLLADAGAKHLDGKPTVTFFKEADADLAPGESAREFGDVRYSWLRWLSDKDLNNGSFAGVSQLASDPRTGQAMNSQITFSEFAIKDLYVQRIDAFLSSLGASQGVNLAGDWKDGPANCKDGDTIPFVATCDAGKNCLSQANARNTLYSKMQQYLNRPAASFGNLGPADFIQTQDDDFFKSYYALLPYQVFADPDANPYVIREGGKGVYGAGATQDWKMLQDEAEFHQRAADIDHGKDPYDYTGSNGLANAATFLNRMRDLTSNHHALNLKKAYEHTHYDAPDAFSFEQIMARDARHCVNGVWETKDQWVQSLIDTYWSQVIWHEFGHALSLRHNFMASVDKPNFPTYKDGAGRTRYSFVASSVMEYNAAPDRVFWHAGWAPYDQAAISWLFANSCKDNLQSSSCTDGKPAGTSISGQVSATSPWADPHGFNADGTEIQYLRCDESHLKYTPFCRQGDMGTTPSEIIANQIEGAEWRYKWNNFRVARKFWDNSAYADAPATLVNELKRFIAPWVFDWSSSEITDTLRRIGIKNPDPNGSDLEYFTQLTNKFNAEMSAANGMAAAYHKAVIQQGSGERPFGTVYDKFYGDVTQQGIILDKLFAMQSWVGLWPLDGYDQNQAGSYVASYEGLGDSTFNSIAEDTVDSMVGGQYNVYPYFRPLAVVQFAQDTHSPNFNGRVSVRDWVGGQVFYRLQDFLDYFRNVAVANNYSDGNGIDCTSQSFEACKYDPRPFSDTHNEFVGPDKRVWIWAYIPDRNEYVAVLKDRNTASYVIVRAYNDDVVTQLDDGAFPGGAFGLELPVKYMLDSFVTYR